MKSNGPIDFSIDKKKNKVNVKKEFDAPIDTVWSAWTESELLDKWWAPKPWKAKTKTMDFRIGGFWLYAMLGPKGEEVWGREDYKSIVPLKHIVAQDAFTDSEGNIDDNLPRTDWKMDFRTSGNSTIVDIELTYEKSSDLEKIINMGFKEGFIQALENLDELLKHTRKAQKIT